MIRRNEGKDWLLIRQVDHARLAAEIAAAWGNKVVDALPMPDLLVPAIRDHDEGWLQWSDAPRIDPEHRRPRDFTEMPMAVSTAIWSSSIELCARHSALGGIWVSRHFCWLAQRARQSRKDNPDDLAAVETFLESQARLCEQWQSEAARERSVDDLEQILDTGFQFVQFFDRLSLWLCCAAAKLEFRTRIPNGETVRFIPGISDVVVVEPFPLSMSRLDLASAAWRIPAKPYADDADLQTEIQHAPTVHLRWRFCRAS